jgi:hypothetical protein
MCFFQILADPAKFLKDPEPTSEKKDLALFPSAGNIPHRFWIQGHRIFFSTEM